GKGAPTELLEVGLAHLEIARQHAGLDLDSLVVTDGIALRLAAATTPVRFSPSSRSGHSPKSGIRRLARHSPACHPLTTGTPHT
ncbi:MAG: hypothetical protein LC679_17485, partial [Intrasporangiaceae bacterium]|nr:hypothetical protein [Intrasporangiaceae bacterium]